LPESSALVSDLFRAWELQFALGDCKK